ncbi:hypothetical protein KQI49_11975 [Virgibacillus sp. MSJ-26]|uniref:Yip1 family protein n=1 Tax=Virgibacillus sp. MSJ-26 TaxID=2841522 RepID=UPI001C105539|nr:hypothetical protein [Virgibacillus sp. MSJ-26]MBU5467537.1 hypothetical protein [Virgibacillus sp. MSJ-26]
MNCPNCGVFIEEGKFCTNCGTKLEETTLPGSTDSENTSEPPQETIAQDTDQPAAESVKEKESGGLDIADYYGRLVKKPSQAIEATANDWIPGLITLIVFALLVGSESYYLMNELAGGYISASFSEDFLVPFLRFDLVLVGVVALTFWGLKFTEKELTFQDVFAKYTAFLIPFVLLFTLGFILELIKLPTVPTAIMGASTNAPLLVIPALIILNSKKKEFDLVYILIAVFAVAYILRALLFEALMSIFT